MKKFASLIVALAMMFSLCISAGAAEDTLTSETFATQDVTVNVTDGTNTGTVYHVNVTWTDLTFEYQKAGEGTWDPSTHTYDNVTENGWVGGNGNTITREGVITVINHSNAPVNVSAEAIDVADKLNVTFKEQSNKVYLPSADNDKYRTAEGGNYDHTDLKAVYNITVGTEGVPTSGVAARARVTISDHTS